ATYRTAGAQTISAADPVTGSLAATSPVSVAPAAASHYRVAAPATKTAGESFSITVTALDAFGNVATGYTGTVHFTSSDPLAILPLDSPLTNGVGTFTATLQSVGPRSVTVSDTAASTVFGVAPVTVNPGTVTHFVVIAPGSVTADVPFNVT